VRPDGTAISGWHCNILKRLQLFTSRKGVTWHKTLIVSNTKNRESPNLIQTSPEHVTYACDKILSLFKQEKTGYDVISSFLQPIDYMR
jgi:hypothetical protein